MERTGFSYNAWSATFSVYPNGYLTWENSDFDHEPGWSSVSSAQRVPRRQVGPPGADSRPVMTGAKPPPGNVARITPRSRGCGPVTCPPARGVNRESGPGEQFNRDTRDSW